MNLLLYPFGPPESDFQISDPTTFDPADHLLKKSHIYPGITQNDPFPRQNAYKTPHGGPKIHFFSKISLPPNPQQCFFFTHVAHVAAFWPNFFLSDFFPKSLKIGRECYVLFWERYFFLSDFFHKIQDGAGKRGRKVSEGSGEVVSSKKVDFGTSRVDFVGILPWE